MKIVNIKTYLKSRYFSLQGNEIVHIISFPKSGRTWTSMMIGKYLLQKYNLTESEYKIEKELTTLSEKLDHIPKIKIHHDGRAFYQMAEDLPRNKAAYYKSKVLLLVRNPLDILVSSYFEKNKRVKARQNANSTEKVFKGTLSDYVYHKEGGIDTIIEFYNIWYDNRFIPNHWQTISYEKLTTETPKSLEKILKFIGEKRINEKILQNVIQECSIEKMRKLEKSMTKGYELSPGDIQDKESFKARKGKINGYVDYLNKEEIDFLIEKINSNLHPFFGY